MSGTCNHEVAFCSFQLRHLLAAFEGLASSSSRFVTVEVHHLLAAFEGLSSSSSRFVTFELGHLLKAFQGLATTRSHFVNLKAQCHEDFAVLGQFCAKIITLRLNFGTRR